MNTPAAARSLLHRARELYQDNPRAMNWLHRNLARFDEPLRIAVLGHPSAGKSTLVRALVGEHVPAQHPEDGQGATWYRTMTLTVIDTPAPDPDALERSVRAWCTDADALLYLVPNPYRKSCAGLRVAHEHPIAASTPVAALTVLSRADELGAGRIDALIAARQVARRFRDESEVRELSQEAVPVSALVASAAAATGEREFAALAALANAPRAELDDALLSADRFVRPEATLPVDAGIRESLLARFGMFGLRLATTLIRQGASDPPALAAQLVQRSGLDELRDAIRRHFADRADLLKARAALMGLDVLLRQEPHPAAAGILGELDRVLAGAHEYSELRLLGDLGADRLRLPHELEAEAARLIGGHGTHPVDRLALDAEYPPNDPRYQQALFGALWRWREHAESASLSPAQRSAAATVVRSCENLAIPVLTT